MRDVVTPRPPLGCTAVLLGLFRAALQEHRLPVTQQREAVARVLFESGARLSADDVIERLAESGEPVGKATVYRTLGLMVRVGLATEHDFDEGFKRYETRLVEFHRQALDALQDEVAAESGFHVLSRQLKLYGLCAACESESGPALRSII